MGSGQRRWRGKWKEYNSAVVLLQRLIREEWEALQRREKEEEAVKEKEKKEKEVTLLLLEFLLLPIS